MRIKAAGSGRKKGTPNKKTLTIQQKADELQCDPFEILIHFAKGDWEALGYVSSDRIKMVTDSGTTIYEDTIPAELRASCAKSACEYLYPKRKALEHSGEISNPYAGKSYEELEKLAKDRIDESK